MFDENKRSSGHPHVALKMNPRNASFAADQMQGVPVAISAVFGSGAS